jgi:hypothetical protein
MSWRKLVAGMVAGSVLAAAAGCIQQKDPPEATLSWLTPPTRAARPADCPMPILNALPNADYQQIAIVEVTDDYNAPSQEMYALAHRKACETGADALVILEDQRQELDKSEAAASGQSARQQAADLPEAGEAGHKGRILNAVAIIYRKSLTTSDSGGGLP